ncbi:MAG: hypothetical protein IJ157_07885 [Clostridia bacterium]|nr:hypothetical protein [Clostridia bacterium]
MEEAQEKRFEELFRRYNAQGLYLFTNFLDLAALSTLQRVLPRLPRAPYTLFGGAEGCERKMLRLGSEEECGYEEPFPIACVLIAPASAKFAEKLSHRDFLGALMNLGFERELLGDIVVREEGAYLFCLERIAPYIAQSLTQVRRTTVRCSQMPELPDGALFKLERQVVQLASVRADALVAHVYKLSRSDAQALFVQGRVFVDGRECRDTGYTPKAGEILSVRGFGRMRYVGVDSLSKKGKSNTAVELFA